MTENGELEETLQVTAGLKALIVFKYFSVALRHFQKIIAFMSGPTLNAQLTNYTVDGQQ